MIRRPPRSTLDRSSAASDVYKRQTLDGVTTTLGRGSSDYSATLIGAALHVDEIQIWTDVDGVQTADPKLVPATRTVPIISYDEAAQLAVLGARVMHPKMIEPVLSRRIPIRIRNSRAPEQDGTLILSLIHISEPTRLLSISY